MKYDPSSFASVDAPKSTSAYPFVPTETRTVGSVNEEAAAAASGSHDDDVVKGSPVVTTLMEGEVITTQNITSKTRTVETVTVSSFIMTFLKELD